MPRTADAHTALVDAARVRRIRQADTDRFNAPFERIQARAKANAAAFTAKRTFALA